MTKTEFDNTITSFNKRITSNKTKHLEVEKKLEDLITKDHNFFLSRIYFTSNDGSQNMFVYQPTFNVLELKIDKGTEYVIGPKSKGLYNTKLIRWCFFTYVKYLGNKIRIQYYNTPFVIEQISYAREIVNVCIIYDLDNWPKNPLRNFTQNLFV